MGELLAQSRSFGLSVTLSMQHTTQLRRIDEAAYEEALNNIGTVVTGEVGYDPAFAERLATDELDADTMANRMSSLSGGEWLVRPASAFGHEPAPPFLVESGSLPPGHLDGDQPLTDIERDTFTAARERMAKRTRTVGVNTTRPTPTPDEQPTTGSVSVEGERAVYVDSTLPYTNRLPFCVTYDRARHVVICTDCERRYDPSLDGIKQAVDCCHEMEQVDRDNVPICDVSLNLSPDEIAGSEYSHRQLAFLQAVYNAHQQRYDPELQYDIVWDSMTRLQEYVGLGSAGLAELREEGLLVQNCSDPHHLYTVTPDGRSEIAIAHREGVAHGHRKGDLSESSLHVMMVEILRRYIEQEYVADQTSPVVDCRTYMDLADGTRLDVAGLDAGGDPVITGEAERMNNDVYRAIPDDYDKMASCGPDEAYWVVKNREAGQKLVQILHDPPEGEQRVGKTYGENSPPRQYRIDQPGLTAVRTLRHLRGMI